MRKQADYRENLRQLREDIDWKILGSHMQEARKQSKFTQAQMESAWGLALITTAVTKTAISILI